MITKFSKEIFTNSQFLPVGAVVDFTRSTPPEGFLNCNGAAVSRVTYAKLFAVIGTTYGAGDGSTTFNVPDFRGRFSEGGESVGQVKPAGLPAITGSIESNNQIELIPPESPVVRGALYVTHQRMLHISTTSSAHDSAVQQINIDASRCSSIYGNSNTVQPASIVVNKCIKY